MYFHRRPTKESLAAMGKLLKKEGESSKISIRHARKNIMDVLKLISSEDDRKRIEKQVRPAVLANH
jgi:ribosome recycling factor